MQDKTMEFHRGRPIDHLHLRVAELQLLDRY